MAFLITSLSAVVDSLIAADSDVLSQPARYRIVQAAVARYSGDKPDEDTLNVTGAASRYYAIAANLTLWQEGLSRVTAIQYPAPTVASNETPVYLDADNWRDDYWQTVTSTQTRYLYLPNHSPAATETMRITYTCPWAWTGCCVCSWSPRTCTGCIIPWPMTRPTPTSASICPGGTACSAPTRPSPGKATRA